MEKEMEKEKNFGQFEYELKNGCGKILGSQSY